MPTVEDALQTQVRNIEAQYGRSMGAWTQLIRMHGLTRHAEMIAWLKSEHGMTHGNANRVALIARDAFAAEAGSVAVGAGGSPSPPPSADGANAVDPVAGLYVGKKAPLRPIHDRVMKTIRSFGDVEVAPKRGYVSLRRRRQFAMLQPAASHVDLGLILPGASAGGRLEPGGTFNAMFSHRVRLRSVDAIDPELEGWLRAAYDGAG